MIERNLRIVIKASQRVVLSGQSQARIDIAPVSEPDQNPTRKDPNTLVPGTR